MELKINENMYVQEKNGGYQICISMSDQSRNYIHCEVIKSLHEVEKYLKELDGLEITGTVEIIKDDTYYRLHVVILVEDANRALHFHSRKLNLNDAFFEKSMIEES